MKWVENVSHDIVLCEHCEGKGYTIRETLIDYHKSIYNHKKLKCHKCQGSGRLKSIITTEYEPYIQQEFDDESQKN